MNHKRVEYHKDGAVSIKTETKIIDFRTIKDYLLWQELEDQKYMIGNKRYPPFRRKK